jgi:hypothetical protein
MPPLRYRPGRYKTARPDLPETVSTLENPVSTLVFSVGTFVFSKVLTVFLPKSRQAKTGQTEAAAVREKTVSTAVLLFIRPIFYQQAYFFKKKRHFSCLLKYFAIFAARKILKSNNHDVLAYKSVLVAPLTVITAVRGQS